MAKHLIDRIARAAGFGEEPACRSADGFSGPRPLDSCEANQRPRRQSDPQALAVLATRDGAARKWGAKWLERFDFEVMVMDSREAMVDVLDTMEPALLVIDAAWWLDDDPPPALAKLHDGDSTRTIVIGTSDREMRRALETRATDVVRRPVNWHAVGRRAAGFERSIATEAELEIARTELEVAWRRADEATQRLDHFTRVDSVTELSRRAVFDQILTRAIDAHRRTGNGVAVIHIDLDRFKAINESFGRRGGDEVLKQVAKRLNGCVRSLDFVARPRAGMASAALARLSGDEFTMMLGNIHDPDDVTKVVQATLDALEKGFAVDGTDVYVSASVGIALAPADGDTCERLLQHAELASIEAKRCGGGLFRFYNPTLNQLTQKNLELDRLLRKSLEFHEFSLSYQPILRVSDQRVVAAEALLRWNHPELGRVPPLDFIPVAEETGLMVPIGAWILRTAIEQAKSWIDEGLPPIRMAVNLALCQILKGSLPEIVREILDEVGLPPHLLELELSERGVLNNGPEIIRQLNEVKELGVRLAVDDFGTGNSAIQYLRSFDLDVLKIDRSYIKGLPDNVDDSAISAAMVAMAHQLNMTVVAEGVEHEEQLQLLRGWGCDEFQGFLVAPPLQPDAFRGVLEKHNTVRDSDSEGEVSLL